QRRVRAHSNAADGRRSDEDAQRGLRARGDAARDGGNEGGARGRAGLELHPHDAAGVGLSLPRLNGSQGRRKRHERAALRRRSGRFDDLGDDVGAAVDRKRGDRRRERDGRPAWRKQRDFVAAEGRNRQAADNGKAGEVTLDPCYHEFPKYFKAMRLRDQAERRFTQRGEQGYAMAALLVAMSIMAVMMTVAMPVWKHQTQREREEELVFRGMQYVHAIALFQRKFANAYPPNVDVLVDQRFLRKKFKDPITNDDFQLLPAGAGTQAPGQTAPQPGSGRGGDAPGAGAAPPTRGTTVAAQPTQTQGQPATGGALRGVSPIGTPGAGGGTTAGIG